MENKKKRIKKCRKEHTLYWLLISLDYAGNMILAVLNDDVEEEKTWTFHLIYILKQHTNQQGFSHQKRLIGAG